MLALSTNRNEEAYAIMQKNTDQSARAEYVRALAAARLGHADEAKAHIAKASADPALAARAATEPDFKRIMQPAGNATTTNE